MLLSPLSLNTPLSITTTSAATNFLICSTNSHKPQPPTLTTTTSLKPLLTTTVTTITTSTPRHVTRTLSDEEDKAEGEEKMLASASAIASVIRRSSNSPVEFTQSVKKDHKVNGLVLPSPDFQRLCAQQLHLFRRIVHPHSLLSVYVRPAGSYVMDRLELRRVTTYPGGAGASDIVILVGNFNMPTGLRAAEAALSSRQVEFAPEHRVIVFPMVKHPFIVGFLVAEFPVMELETDKFPFPEIAYDALPPSQEKKSVWGEAMSGGQEDRICGLSDGQLLNATNISHSLATAYIMDQKAILLQQSSWQNNLRMSNLVEQIRGPLSCIQTLSKMLCTQMKRSEISYDIAEDILVQGNRMRDTLEELQDAVYLTKANIVRYNEDTLKKISSSTYSHSESTESQLPYNLPQVNSNKFHDSFEPLSLNASAKDLEMPMPPLALAPLQHGIRPCKAFEVLLDLVDAVRPLARNQQRTVELKELSQSSQVAVEEPALRQALSNLIEGALLRTNVGGKVEIVLTKAPAGGTLVVIDDDGPDMQYMTQMHSLTPFGEELFSENMVEDNMTWNFVAGLTVAREILESYGCVVRVVSPRSTDAALGAGGTRAELWLPSFTSSPGEDDATSNA